VQILPQRRRRPIEGSGLVVDRLHWRSGGEVLDIGCGDGALAIAIAKAHPAAHAVGVDRWGSAWEFSKTASERNAAAEAVAERVAFQPASAAALPFDAGAFDVAVSNPVFHEVRDVADKKLLLKEALRVLRNGGIFVFQDLFLWRRIYGGADDLIGAIKSWGIAEAHFSPANGASFIPWALKLPLMLGTMAIIHGVWWPDLSGRAKPFLDRSRRRAPAPCKELLHGPS